MFEYDSGLKAIDNEKVKKLEAEVIKKIQEDNKHKLTKEDLNKPTEADQIKRVSGDMEKNLLDKVADEDPSFIELNIIEDEYESEHPEE